MICGHVILQSSNISSEWKQLLDTVGVTEEQLKDKDMANFIYDFVEKHGGIKEANCQLEASRSRKPPLPSHSHGASAPPSSNIPPPPHPPPPSSN